MTVLGWCGSLRAGSELNRPSLPPASTFHIELQRLRSGLSVLSRGLSHRLSDDLSANLEFQLKKIYVGNLPYQTTEEEIESVFSDFGTVLNVSIIRDRQTGRSRGFGFVEMENDPDAQKAIEGLNGHELNGRSLVVNEARERSRSQSGGSGDGGYHPSGGSPW